MTPATDRQSDERWELHDVQALSTEEIRDKLAEHGIDTTEASFRDRAAEVDSAMALADQWEDDHDVDASGYDQDFIWMAAEVFWSRWASDLPYRERIYDLVQEGRELREQGNDAEACQQWLTAWETIIAVTPEDITTIEAADDHLPNVLSSLNHSCGRSTTTLPPWQRTIQPITSDASNSVGGLYPVSGCT